MFWARAKSGVVMSEHVDANGVLEAVALLTEAFLHHSCELRLGRSAIIV